MGLARIRLLQRVLREKYGIYGEVAARYVEAGAHVRLMHPTRYGPIHILVYKDGEKYVIEVFKASTMVPRETVEALKKKADLVRAKPILVLYGDGPKLTDDIYKLCKELGIKIRRIRAQ